MLQLAPLPLKQTRITFVSSAALRVHLKGANECNYSASLSAFKCLCVLFVFFFFFSKRYAKYLQAVLICFRRQGRKLQIDFLFINFMECGSCLKHIFCAREGRHLLFSVKGSLLWFFPSHFQYPVNLCLWQYCLFSFLQKKESCTRSER